LDIPSTLKKSHLRFSKFEFKEIRHFLINLKEAQIQQSFILKKIEWWSLWGNIFFKVRSQSSLSSFSTKRDEKFFSLNLNETKLNFN